MPVGVEPVGTGVGRLFGGVTAHPHLEKAAGAFGDRIDANRVLLGAQPMTASFGIASFPLHARTKEELVQRADRAMQSVKTTTNNAIGTAERRRDGDGS